MPNHRRIRYIHQDCCSHFQLWPLLPASDPSNYRRIKAPPYHPLAYHPQGSDVGPKTQLPNHQQSKTAEAPPPRNSGPPTTFRYIPSPLRCHPLFAALLPPPPYFIPTWPGLPFVLCYCRCWFPGSLLIPQRGARRGTSPPLGVPLSRKRSRWAKIGRAHV